MSTTALTENQMRTVKMAARYGQKLAAEHLGVSVQTVKNTLSATYHKLGTYSLNETLCRLWLDAIWEAGDDAPALQRALSAEAKLATIRAALDGQP